MKNIVWTALLPCIASCVVAGTLSVNPSSNLDEAVGKLRPGDTLQFAEGIYSQTLYLSGLHGEEQRPITIRGSQGTILRPKARDAVVCWGGGGSEHVILEELTIVGASRAGIIGSGMHDVTIRNCTIMSNGVWGVQTCLSSDIRVESCIVAYSKEQHGIYFSTTDRPVARGNHVFGNASCGIHLNGDMSEGGDGLIEGAMIAGNRIYDNGRTGGAAINMDGVTRSTIVNNMIYGNLSGGVTSFHQNGKETGDHNIFMRNTIYFERGKGRFGLQIAGPCDGTVIEGNIIVCGRGPALEFDLQALGGLRETRNVFWSYGRRNLINEGSITDWRRLSGQSAASVELDPLFSDPGRGDFSFRPRSAVRGYSAGARLAGH